MNSKSRNTQYALLAALLLGFFLRAHALGAQSFWLDEAYMWGVVKNAHLWDAVKAMLLLNSTTPLGYLVIWLTVPLFGLTEFGLRLSSALIGVLTIPVVYRLGREMFDRNVGALSGMIITFMPFVILIGK